MNVGYLTLVWYNQCSKIQGVIVMHKVNAKQLLSSDNGMNIYRGCTHGCIYCDARSKCYQMNHAFEDIEVKENAPIILEEKLKRKRKKAMIATGAMSDPYIPEEKQLLKTKACLEVIEKYGFGLCIQTKSNLILRDLDLLKAINKKSKCVVQMTLTTADINLCRKIEPNVCTTDKRVEALKIFASNGIPTVVWLCPFLPFINDTEENILSLMRQCVDTGVKGIICYGIGVTLREGSREHFYKQLDYKFPRLKYKYINHYGNSYELLSPNNDKLMKIIAAECENNGIMLGNDKVFEYMKTYQSNEYIQMDLFDLM